MRRLLAKMLIAAGAAGLAGTVLPLGGASAAVTIAPPSWNAPAYNVTVAHQVTMRLGTRLTSTRPGRCALTLAGPKHLPVRWRMPQVAGDYLIYITPPMRATPGRWTITAECIANGDTAGVRSSRFINVRGYATGTASLVPASGPRLDPLFSWNGSIGDGGVVAQNPGFPNGQCTYLAWLRRPDIYTQSEAGGAPPWDWDAWKWASHASQYGKFPTGPTALAGAIMVTPRTGPNSVGHVAYVQSVIDGNHFVTEEMNFDWQGVPNGIFVVHNYVGTAPAGAPTPRRIVPAGTVFIYGGPVVTPPQYAGYINQIVQWAGDTKAQKTAWLVVNDGGYIRRRWIPDIATYWCLKNAGSPGPVKLPAADLDAMVDQTGVRATCVGNSAQSPGSGSGDAGGADVIGGQDPPGGPPPPPDIPPGSPTFTAIQGSRGVNTFADVHSASGLGTRIAAGQSVQVSCKVHDGTIPSVNPDGYWYRIASSPWNDMYYAPANTFMNGDPWGGPYTHNTDFSIPDCGATPTQPPPTQPPPALTYPEQQGSRGVNTFTNYHNASGMGPRIEPATWVQVSCKVHDPTIASVNPDGYWYRIASAPWNDQYYAPANTFMNGDPWGGPYSHNTDFNVRDC